MYVVMDYMCIFLIAYRRQYVRESPSQSCSIAFRAFEACNVHVGGCKRTKNETRYSLIERIALIESVLGEVTART